MVWKCFICDEEAEYIMNGLTVCKEHKDPFNKKLIDLLVTQLILVQKGTEKRWENLAKKEKKKKKKDPEKEGPTYIG